MTAVPRVLSIVIPVYNEERHIEEVLRRVLAVELEGGMTKEIVIVDDGSTDLSPKILDTFAALANVRVHRSEKNGGKGAACRIGLGFVTGDAVIFQDADLEYDPKFYPALLRPMLDDGAQVVYGSRFKGSIRGMRLPNLVANVLLRVTANILFRADITDEATGFKLLHIDVVRSMTLSSDRFDLCPEITAKVRKAGLKIHEVPIDYVARTHADGKKIRWHDGFHAMWTLLKFRFRD